MLLSHLRWDVAVPKCDANPLEPRDSVRARKMTRDVAGSEPDEKRPADHLPALAGEFDAVLRALPDLYFLLDAERKFIDFNAGRNADLYRSPEEFLGRHFDEILPPDVAKGMSVAMDRAHARNEVVTYDYALEIDGDFQWYEVRFASFGHGMTVALVRNVTERRRAAEELRLQQERNRQAEKLESLGRVAGGIAHDFNNLLTVIGASCTIAARRIAPDHAAQEPLAEAQAALRAAADLTRHLLAFARRESVGMDVLDVDKVVDEMEFILRGLACAPIAFTRERSATPIRIRGVRVQLEQVLLNLVVNAVDAMPRGGDLTLRTFVVQVASEGCIELSDTGSGMSTEVVARALEPFFSTKPEGKGTGLGLATVDGIVRAAGGRVEIESAVGAGTTVSIRLPLLEV